MTAPAALNGYRRICPEPPQGLPGTTNGYRRICPECGEEFRASQPRGLFCSTAHKRSYNNRWLKRGAVLAPLYAAARATRGGTRGDRATGARARRDADMLVQKWKDEDAAAGRMTAADYVALRYRLGYVDVVR